MAISLKNPQLERLTATPESRTYTVAVITIVVVVLLVFLAIRPSVASVFDKLNQNEKKRDFIEQMEQKQQNLVALSANEVNQASQLQLLDEAFPEERKENEVLDKVTQLVVSNSLGLKSIDVVITEEKSNIDTTLDPNTAYAIVTVTATGVRSDAWAFVEDLENENRVVNLQKVGVTSRLDENGNVSSISDIEIVFEIYYYDKPDV